MSYVNLVMYGAVIPSYNSKRNKDGKAQEVIMADDPRNRDKVKQFFDSIE
jgi:hypothetical protein